MTRTLIRTEHGHVHVRSSGDGDLPLVMLHMSLSSSRMFRHITPLLETSRRVVTPDRLGSGVSDHPQAPISLAQYADATVEALSGMGIDRFDVVGIHTGSCEAIELAANHPDRVRSIAVVAVPVFASDEISDYKDSYLHEPEPDHDGSHLDWYWRWWRDGGFGGAAVRSKAWDPELLHEFVMDHLLCQPDAWYGHHAVFEHDTGGLLGKIRQPFLALHVADDLDAETTRALPLLPPQAEVVSLPHLTDVLGHFTTASPEIANHLQAFLDRQAEES
jgi:pimeloyl-ACP methyl ester carboxylesterase